MGTDKARLQVGGRSLIEHALAALEEVAEPVVLAPGAAPRYGELGRELVLDAPTEPGEPSAAGPLAGLLAVLEAARTDWVAVLACDLPRIAPELIGRLHRRALERGADACLFATRGGLEPLIAVYHRRCAPAVRAALEAGERRLVAFHPGLSVATVHEDELGPELRGRELATNVNEPAELAAERRRCAP